MESVWYRGSRCVIATQYTMDPIIMMEEIRTGGKLVFVSRTMRWAVHEAVLTNKATRH